MKWVTPILINLATFSKHSFFLPTIRKASTILLITFIGSRLRWHGRWFETRRVAEYLRHAPILLLLGPLHFGLIYYGFSIVENLSPLVVSLQLWIPMTAFFAWRVLGEKMAPAALAGMVVAFVGVAWMSLDPHAVGDLPGIIVGVIASAMWALGTVLVRRSPAVTPLKMQALTSAVGAPVLLAAAVMFEPNLIERSANAGLFVWSTIVWAALASTVGASALLFWLVQRREPGR